MRAAILLDVPNLLRGGPRPANEALFKAQLDAIDRCAARLLGEATPARAAFALQGITSPDVEAPLRAAGYLLTWCSAERTASMDLKRMSRIDDYVLQCTAKSWAREGVRGLLIASADRDPEDVAFDLGGTGTRVVFAQWDPVPARRSSRIERVCLRDERPDPTPAPRAGVTLRRGGTVLASAPLRDGLLLGRSSNTHGRPDLDLGVGGLAGADAHRYSRRLAIIRKLGEAWCLWRLPETEGPIETSDGDDLPAGAGALLRSGETVFRLAAVGVELIINVGPAAAQRGDTNALST